jgi:hypothetical protein
MPHNGQGLAWWCWRTGLTGTLEVEQDFMATMAQLGLSSAEDKQVIIVGAELASSAWPHFEVLLEDTRKHWELYYTLESLQECLANGTMQLWLMNDKKEFQLGMLTELVKYPSGVKQVQILWIGGKNLRDAKHFADYFEQWAAKRGVSEIRAYARKGLERVLAPLGYVAKQVVLVKNVKVKMES